MTVSLVKGQNVSLTKASPTLATMTVGLGWDVRRGSGPDFDLDAIAFLLGDDGRVANDKRMVFFGNTSCDGVTLSGDNRTGAGDGDDETIKIDLSALPDDVRSIDIAIAIYETASGTINFGLVDKSSVRIVDDVTGVELARLDLQEDASTESAILMGNLYRAGDGTEWKFRAKGDTFPDLRQMAVHYGVNV